MLRKVYQLLQSPITKVLGLSVFFTSTVSSLFGTGFYLLNKSFWPAFFIATALQLLFFVLYNTVRQTSDYETISRIETDRLNAEAKYKVKLGCSYCKIANVVPIVLNTENRYKCESCNQINGVKLQFISTQITTPITTPIPEAISSIIAAHSPSMQPSSDSPQSPS